MGPAAMVTVKYPYVYEDVDRHGNVRLYFWRGKGQPKVRLREVPGTEAFAARYDELVQPSNPGAHNADGGVPKSGTWRWLCVEYFRWLARQRLDPSTQTTRRRILESTFNEPLHPGAKQTFAKFPIVRFSAEALCVLRDRKAHMPEAANGRVKAIRAVFAWALKENTSPPTRRMMYCGSSTRPPATTVGRRRR
jgi:hypothetical protein